jgi:hypothetical protein
MYGAPALFCCYAVLVIGWAGANSGVPALFFSQTHSLLDRAGVLRTFPGSIRYQERFLVAASALVVEECLQSLRCRDCLWW